MKRVLKANVERLGAEWLDALLREAGALEHRDPMERPAWTKVREQLEAAPRRRSGGVPALCLGVAAACAAAALVWWAGRQSHPTQAEPPQLVQSPSPHRTPVSAKGPGLKIKGSKAPNTQSAVRNPQPATRNRRPPTRNRQPSERQPAPAPPPEPEMVVMARTYAPGGYQTTTTWQGDVQTTMTTSTQTQPSLIVVRTTYPSQTTTSAEPSEERAEPMTIKSASALPTVIPSGDMLTRQTVVSTQPPEPAEEKTAVRPLLKPKLSLNLLASQPTVE